MLKAGQLKLEPKFSKDYQFTGVVFEFVVRLDGHRGGDATPGLQKNVRAGRQR